MNVKTFGAPALLGLCAVALAGCNTTGPNELALSRSTDSPVEMAAHLAAVETPAQTPAPEARPAEAGAAQGEAATAGQPADKPSLKTAALKHSTTGQHGLASWYQLRGRTACGNMNNPAAMTAAHRTLPCGTRVLVTNLRNGRSVHVTITDRGPFTPRRIVDVSRAAAHQLGLVGAGIAPVRVSSVSMETSRRQQVTPDP